MKKRQHINNIVLPCTRLLVSGLCSIFLLFSSPVSGQVIFSNTITDPNPSSYNPFTLGQFIDPHISVSGIQRGSGITAAIGTDRYNAANFASAVKDTADYFSFIMIPDSGYQINFTNFSYTGLRSSTGPVAFSLRSSINGYAANIGTLNASGTTISLSALAFQNVRVPIEFRLYCWGATNSSGIYGIDEFSFGGDLSLEPQLSATALAGFGSLCSGVSSNANTFSLAGINLTADTVKINRLAGYSFSLDNLNFYDSLNLILPGFQTTLIYVKFTPTAATFYNNNIIISGGGASEILVPASGRGLGTLPIITPGAISNLTISGATITATIRNSGCSVITGYGIEYSTTAGFANGTGTIIPASNLLSSNFSVDLSGLTAPGQTFYFHTYAFNSIGIKYGVENSFTLLYNSPNLYVPPIGGGSLTDFGNVCINSTSITHTFTLTGSLLDGSNVTIGPLSNFSFSTQTNGPFTNSLTLVSGSGAVPNYNSGNIPNITIYVRFTPTTVNNYNGLLPISGGGAPSINIQAIASGVNSTPLVNSGNAVQITYSSALLQGNVLSAGCTAITSYGFEYSTTAGFLPGTGTRISASNLLSNAFSLPLSGLNPSTVYYYYTYATNSGGTVFGNINNFFTGAVPTQLLITSISPSSPFELAPFSITITAVDNLTDRNPINVISNTSININLIAGNNNLTVPVSSAATMLIGTNSITISGLFYDVAEYIGISATAVSGMTTLETSPVFYFNVLHYTGGGDFIWSQNGGNAWLNGNNWQIGRPPGASLYVNNHKAYFTNLASIDNSVNGGWCGIDMRSVGGHFRLGSIIFENTYTTNHFNRVIKIGNSSDLSSGVLSLHSAIVNNLGGIPGNNYSRLLLANYMNGSSTKTLEINNHVGSGNQILVLNIPDSGSVVAAPGDTININVVMSGNQPITFEGGGVFNLNPSGLSNENIFSGIVNIANGKLIAGNQGAFNTSSPSNITFGSILPGNGILDLNGNNITVGSIFTFGPLGLQNIITSGISSATLTINNVDSSFFDGLITDGISGSLSIVKKGSGTVLLSSQNTFTGTTTISDGIIKLNNTAGNTISSDNSIIVNGGELYIASNQTIKNLTLNNGILRIDSSVTLTITGSYNAGSATIINNGTIKINCINNQSFPGSAVIVDKMNNLNIDNIANVELNNDLNVQGVLTLSNGIFVVGRHVLTINNPIEGNGVLFADGISSVVIAGIAPNIILPSNVNSLYDFTVTNIAGTTLQGDLLILGNLTISDGVVEVPLNISLNGPGNLVMTGGELRLFKNGVIIPELTGNYSLSGGVVSFAGDGVGMNAQTIRPINYFNLLSVSNGGERILSDTGTIGVSNSFIPGTNNYKITGSTVDFNKLSDQFIPQFDFYHLKISGGNNAIKSLAGNISVKSRLSFSENTNLDLGNYEVTLKSDSALTASVDIIPTDNSIKYTGTGRFIVERFIPTSLTHSKSWQFLATPAFGSSINECWQESNSPLQNGSPFYGTTISGDKPGAVSRGFDFYTPSGSSVKYYNNVTNSWTGIDDGISNTTSLQLSNKSGYMVFVRGNRSVQTYSSPATITNLRTKGKLFARGFDQPESVIVEAEKLQSVGNPYASEIDFVSLLNNSSSIDEKYYVWDPLLPGSLGYGGFQTFSSATGYTPIPGGTENYNSNLSYTQIQSGQAFFTYSTSGGVVNFSEYIKSSGNATPFRQARTHNSSRINLKLFNANNLLADGNAVLFSADFPNEFEANDAVKISNFGENVSISHNNKLLAIDARNSLTSEDTVFYNLGNLRPLQYRFEIEPVDFYGNIFQAFLVDNYLSTQTIISLSAINSYSFNVNADSASYARNRFYVVFKPLSPLPINAIEITAISQNNKSVLINCKVTNENNVADYELEKSLDGLIFNKIKDFVPSDNNGGIATYQYTDEHPKQGVNYYRIKKISTNGLIKWSEIARAQILSSVPELSIFPNPIKNNVINLELNGLPAGTYQSKIINISGQVIARLNFKLLQNESHKTLIVNRMLSPGNYYLILNNNKVFFTIE